MRRSKQDGGIAGWWDSRMVGARTGQSLIEVIVSVSIAVILAISLISMSIVTTRAARAAKNNTEATKLAQEYIEQIRVYRDRKEYVAIVNETGCKVVSNSVDPNPVNWTLSACSDPDGELITSDVTTFKRKIDFVPADAGTDKRLIKVTITWQDVGGMQTVVNETYLTKWDSI